MYHDDLAVRARTVVDEARVGLLTAPGRCAGGRVSTAVSVSARADGSVDVLLGRDDPAVPRLLARPLASLRVAAVDGDVVLLHGAAHRVPSRAGTGGHLVFHVQAAAVRLGEPPVPVDEERYACAEPDPLRREAPALLAHLNAAHRQALAACLRARGREVAFAEALRLDGRGLTVLAVGPCGVERVRLPFPQPVAALADLPAGLRRVLVPGCTCTGVHPR